MKIIKQSAYWFAYPEQPDCYKIINKAGRVSHKSEAKDYADMVRFVNDITNNWKHLSVLEHCSMSAVLITDRGVSHEIVRHRIASFTQESTRYCNYSRDKFDNEVTFIEPVWGADEDWTRAMHYAEKVYLILLSKGQTPQQARSVLPNSLKTEIFMTANMREWRLIFEQRCISKAAHPQMRDLMLPLYMGARERYPEIFDLGEPE